MCIFLSAVIYLAVGYHVFHRRNQLRNLTLSNQGKDMSSSDVRESAEKVIHPPRRQLSPSFPHRSAVVLEPDRSTNLLYSPPPSKTSQASFLP